MVDLIMGAMLAFVAFSFVGLFIPEVFAFYTFVLIVGALVFANVCLLAVGKKLVDWISLSEWRLAIVFPIIAFEVCMGYACWSYHFQFHRAVTGKPYVKYGSFPSNYSLVKYSIPTKGVVYYISLESPSLKILSGKKVIGVKQLHTLHPKKVTITGEVEYCILDEGDAIGGCDTRESTLDFTQ